MTIGLDVGGSKIRGVLWDGKKIRRRVEFSTPKNLKIFENILNRVFGFLNASVSVKKVGIGVAGVIKKNKVVSATNISYLKNFDFSKLLNTECLIVMDNDARCFARAEYRLRIAKGIKNVLFVTLGTGIGRAYVKNEKVLNIKKFEYPEKWEKEYQKIREKNALAEFLNKKLGIIINTLNPESIVLGGGVVMKKGYFEAIKKILETRFLTLDIRRSKLSKFAGAIGAAMLFSTPH